jgi:hypothetical protein
LPTGKKLAGPVNVRDRRFVAVNGKSVIIRSQEMGTSFGLRWSTVMDDNA